MHEWSAGSSEMGSITYGGGRRSPSTSVGCSVAGGSCSGVAGVLSGARWCGGVVGVPLELEDKPEWLWLLGGRFGCWWVLHYGVGSSGSSTALQAKVEALAAAWRSGECGGGIGIGLWSFWSEVAWLEDFGQIGCRGVCGGS